MTLPVTSVLPPSRQVPSVVTKLLPDTGLRSRPTLVAASFSATAPSAPLSSTVATSPSPAPGLWTEHSLDTFALHPVNTTNTLPTAFAPVILPLLVLALHVIVVPG